MGVMAAAGLSTGPASAAELNQPNVSAVTLPVGVDHEVSHETVTLPARYDGGDALSTGLQMHEHPPGHVVTDPTDHTPPATAHAASAGDESDDPVGLLHLIPLDLDAWQPGDSQPYDPTDGTLSLIQPIDPALRVGHGYALLHNFPVESVSLQVGRQRFRDRREWLIDEQLDAVRVVLDQEPFSIDFSVSSLLDGPGDQSDNVTNFVVFATYGFGHHPSEKITTFVIARQDDSPDNRDPLFVGLSWAGTVVDQHRVWVDTAFLLGEDRGTDLRGFGVDVGWIQRIDHPLNPALTLAFAFGSGDSDRDDGTDGTFQQTRLHDNVSQFDGDNPFKYYGEVFDPELSNMMIFTAAAGITPNETLSLDVIYHYYALVEQTAELRNVGVTKALTGDDTDLGQEIDLVLGSMLSDEIRATVTTGVFLPGPAFKSDTVIYGVEFKVQISY